MRIITLLFIIVGQLASAQVTQFKEDDAVSVFDGTIGNAPIHMELSNLNGQIIGWYQYPGKSTKLRIEGTIKNDGSVDLNEYTYRAVHTGHFSGKIQKDHSIFGKWNNPDNSKKIHFMAELSNNLPLIELKSNEEANSNDSSIEEVVVKQTSLEENLTLKKQRKMFQPSKVKGYSKLALWTTIILVTMLAGVVIFLIRSRKKLKEKPKEIHTKEVIREVQYVNESITPEELRHKQGELFQKCVVEMFLKKKEYFEWVDSTRDLKYGEHYPQSNFNPDLLIRFKYEKYNWEEDIAVECKYRAGDKNGVVFIDEERKLNNYKEFQRKNNIKTFLALGVGGNSSKPNLLFVLPIDSVQSEMHLIDLAQFMNMKSYFYYNYNEKTLK